MKDITMKNQLNDEASPEMASSVRARRNLLTKTAIAAAGIAGMRLFAPVRALAVTPALTFNNIPGTGDIKVLNYALALEDLEADLYAQALMRLTNGGVNALGIRITGLNLNQNQPDVLYTREFGKVEVQHRNFLQSALGSQAIPLFKYNFSMQSQSRQQVLTLIYNAEKLGVGAYLGAIQFLQTETYLQTAGAIQGTEARHTAVIAEIIDSLFSETLPVAPLSAEFGGNNNGLDAPVDPNTVLATVSPFIVT
jgi:Ferritin-like domain